MINTIHNFEYDEYSDCLIVEFSTDEDGEEFFRKDNIEIELLSLYAPADYFSDKNWVAKTEQQDLKDMLGEYYFGNELPEPQLL